MKKSVYLLFVSLLLLGACNSFDESPYPDIQLSEKASLPLVGLSSASACVSGDYAYILFGRTDTLNKNIYQYNPALNSYNVHSVFPAQLRVNGIAQCVDGLIYAGLGFAPGNGIYIQSAYLTDFWCYNPLTNVWEQKADFPSNTTDKCVSFVFNNQMYVGYGFNGFEYKNEMWKYDPATDTWLKLNAGTPKRRSVAVACATDEKVFFGTGFKTGNLNDWWEYFPETDSWAKRKSIPDNGRVNATAFTVDNRIFVATGRYFSGDLTGGGVKADILEYDILKDIWYYRGSLDQGRENAISFTFGHTAYLGFGESESELLNDLWSFDVNN